MQGYDDTSYGDAFADVYDEWYADVSDVGATVAALSDLAARAGNGPMLELGVGTGRLAAPLAAAGATVYGIDTSAAMLARIAGKAGGAQVQAICGDMVDDLPPGPFAVVFVAYNTFFGLLTEERQRACFAAVAARLAPEGSFAIEAFVPEPAPGGAGADSADTAAPGGAVSVKSITATQVVLSVSTVDHAGQRADGQYVQFTEHGGVRLRPWSIRWATPHQLDDMAAGAGLRLTDRWGGFDRSPFHPDSTRHVSVYAPASPA